jgi:hypothetical protein
MLASSPRGMGTGLVVKELTLWPLHPAIAIEAAQNPVSLQKIKFKAMQVQCGYVKGN